VKFSFNRGILYKSVQKLYLPPGKKKVSSFSKIPIVTTPSALIVPLFWPQWYLFFPLHFSLSFIFRFFPVLHLPSFSVSLLIFFPTSVKFPLPLFSDIAYFARAFVKTLAPVEIVVTHVLGQRLLCSGLVVSASSALISCTR
jgi:hypothetical protein